MDGGGCVGFGMEEVVLVFGLEEVVLVLGWKRLCWFWGGRGLCVSLNANPFYDPLLHVKRFALFSFLFFSYPWITLHVMSSGFFADTTYFTTLLVVLCAVSFSTACG